MCSRARPANTSTPFPPTLGTLHSIDQYLNIKLLNTKVVDASRHPQLVAVTSVPRAGAVSLEAWGETIHPRRAQVFVRGSVVRYIQIPAADVDTELLFFFSPASPRRPPCRDRPARPLRRQDACRKASAKA